MNAFKTVIASRLLPVFLLLAACGYAGTQCAAAEPVFPPGLRVGLEPAGDLKVTPGFSGFKDADRQAAVSIAELPGAAYESLVRALFGEAPAGAADIGREIFPFRGGVGYLHAARITEKGIASKRWLLLARPVGLQEDFVALISVTIPEAASKFYSDAVVRSMLSSVAFREPPIEERLDLIPFKLGDLAGFRVAQVSPQSVLLIDGPGNDLGSQPYVIVSIGIAERTKMDDRARFSRDLLVNAPLRNLTIRSADQMRIGGNPGFEIRATAEDLRDNKLAIVQWVRFTGGGFLRIVGAASADRWDEMFNRFRAVRDGVDLR